MGLWRFWSTDQCQFLSSERRKCIVRWVNLWFLERDWQREVLQLGLWTPESSLLTFLPFFHKGFVSVTLSLCILKVSPAGRQREMAITGVLGVCTLAPLAGTAAHLPLLKTVLQSEQVVASPPRSSFAPAFCFALCCQIGTMTAGWGDISFIQRWECAEVWHSYLPSWKVSEWGGRKLIDCWES